MFPDQRNPYHYQMKNKIPGFGDSWRYLSGGELGGGFGDEDLIRLVVREIGIGLREYRLEFYLDPEGWNPGPEIREQLAGKSHL
ncbi:hypothetical protein METEAL_07400 [Mesoterricola silvestris]|uniref:Uncharacterized protein n=1 Tax=Mesoterricola silvestris TaxID=2927979 RepID=A0AA48GTP4_9BACT|nr:hypothetical protein METEAL_07400 [Mesoterricola silvestris]